jgi:hypothetical protein
VGTAGSGEKAAAAAASALPDRSHADSSPTNHTRTELLLMRNASPRGELTNRDSAARNAAAPLRCAKSRR